jgi:hypothetical protein
MLAKTFISFGYLLDMRPVYAVFALPGFHKTIEKMDAKRTGLL